MGDNKMGRPPIDNPKNAQVKIRVYPEDRERLIKCCKDNNITQYDVLMTGINAVEEKK